MIIIFCFFSCQFHELIKHLVLKLKACKWVLHLKIQTVEVNTKAFFCILCSALTSARELADKSVPLSALDTQTDCPYKIIMTSHEKTGYWGATTLQILWYDEIKVQVQYCHKIQLKKSVAFKILVKEIVKIIADSICVPFMLTLLCLTKRTGESANLISLHIFFSSVNKPTKWEKSFGRRLLFFVGIICKSIFSGRK